MVKWYFLHNNSTSLQAPFSTAFYQCSGDTPLFPQSPELFVGNEDDITNILYIGLWNGNYIFNKWLAVSSSCPCPSPRNKEMKTMDLFYSILYLKWVSSSAGVSSIISTLAMGKLSLKATSLLHVPLPSMYMCVAVYIFGGCICMCSCVCMCLYMS